MKKERSILITCAQKLVFLSIVIFVIQPTSAQQYQFTYATPESKGYSSQKFDTLSAFLEKRGSSAMIMMVDEHVIFQWGAVDKVHMVHSIRKALINALYGIKIAEGIIDTSMTLRELHLDDIKPRLTAKEKSATIADLLKSRSGVYHDAAAVSEGMLADRPVRGTYKPGEHYYYNNWDFNVLGYILERKTGKTIFQLFKDEIAIPLGMHDYKGAYATIDGESDEPLNATTDGVYQFEKSKSKYPAYHFRMSARDLAIFGQLYLNNGAWAGKQIIPREWIAVSTKPYSMTNPTYGIAYGMLWNLLVEMEGRKGTSFFHTGVGVHMLGVYPSARLILIHRVDTEKEYSFHEGDFYEMIGLAFGAQQQP
jgi:CubicO group peptidase (beta-lactamase class C family)